MFAHPKETAVHMLFNARTATPTNPPETFSDGRFEVFQRIKRNPSTLGNNSHHLRSAWTARVHVVHTEISSRSMGYPTAAVRAPAHRPAPIAHRPIHVLGSRTDGAAPNSTQAQKWIMVIGLPACQILGFPTEDGAHTQSC